MSARRTSLSLVGAAVLMTVLSGAPAYAHADYRDSSPADGGSVSSPPGEVWAEFTEQPVEGSSLVIVDPCGRRVDNGDYSYQPYPINRITVTMSADTAGEYVVTWTVTSDADGHTTRGTFSFVSEGGSSCPKEGESSGGSGGSEGSGGSGSTRRSASSEGTSETGTNSEDPAEATSGTQEGSREEKRARRSGRARDRKKTDRKSAGNASIELTTQDRAVDVTSREEGSDEIPLDWLVVGLSISALIGAAGGRIYVNIVAPRR